MNDLISLWEALFNNLKATECLRERISKRPSFDKQAAFRYCDRDCDGYLSVEDLMKVLVEHNGGNCANEKEVLLIINKFKGIGLRLSGGANISGVPRDAKISLKEYIEEVTPKIEPIATIE